MADLTIYQRETCPKCGRDTFHRLGDGLKAYMPIGEEGSPENHAAFYVKVCGNCAYSEMYAQYLIDQFERRAAQAEGFGQVSRAPSGLYLISIWKNYEHEGQQAHDFTVPLSSEEWFNVQILVDSVDDERLVQLVLKEPYLKAWRDRVGDIPPDFAANLRELIKAHSHKDLSTERGKALDTLVQAQSEIIAGLRRELSSIVETTESDLDRVYPPWRDRGTQGLPETMLEHVKALMNARAMARDGLGHAASMNVDAASLRLQEALSLLEG